MPKLVVFALVWVALLGVGFRSALRYEVTPGDGADGPERWPAGSALARSAGRPTLVMFAHPRCPCTRASMSELGEIVRAAAAAPAGAPPKVHVVFVRPAGADAAWADTDVVHAARRIAGVETVMDDDGAEISRFGALTSGQVMLFDANGRRLFSGGITGMRGHPGDNAGRRRVLDILAGRTPDKAESLVFGCALKSDAERGAQTAPTQGGE